MGYRNYLYTIPKKNVKKVRGKKLKELEEKYGNKEDDNYFDYKDVLKDMKCIFEYGKLYWDDTVERIHNTGEQLFLDEDVQDRFEDYDIYLVGKDALKVTIEIYENKIKEMYKKLLDNTNLSDEEIKYKYENHIEEYNSWWRTKWMNTINLDENDECICNSWLYEHLIFELVRLYKTIDFEKYDLVFLGY